MKKKVIISLALIIAVAVSFTLYENYEKKETKEVMEHYTPVEVEKVKTKTIVKEEIFTGEIKAHTKLDIISQITDEVELINISLGDKVSKGELLIELKKDEVKKDIERKKVSLERAKGNYELAKEVLDEKEEDFKRKTKLYKEGIISKSEYEKIEIDASPMRLKIEEANLNEAIVVYNHSLDELNKAKILSPIDGVIAHVNIKEGERVSVGYKLASVVDLNNLFVEVNVTENTIGKLQKGKEVKIQLEAIELDEKIVGKIENVSPVADEKTKLYSVKIKIESDEENRIKPGMFAKVNIPMKIKKNALVVESQSVVKANGLDVVYVINKDKASERKVVTGLDEGDYIEIVEGLKEGELVVTKGQNYLKNKSIIKVVGGEK